MLQTIFYCQTPNPKQHPYRTTNTAVTDAAAPVQEDASVSLIMDFKIAKPIAKRILSRVYMTCCQPPALVQYCTACLTLPSAGCLHADHRTVRTVQYIQRAVQYISHAPVTKREANLSCLSCVRLGGRAQWGVSVSIVYTRSYTVYSRFVQSTVQKNVL